MGLDVSLYHNTDQKKVKELNKRDNENWKLFKEDMPQIEKDKINKRSDTIRQQIEKYEKRIEMPSEKYPDHLFKIGYFRSSYNDGGIERVFTRMLGHNLLYTIFDVDEDNTFRGDWHIVLDRAKDMLAEWKNFLKDKDNLYECYFIGTNIFIKEPIVTSEHQALEIFKKELHKSKNLGNYSFREGEFFLKDPLLVEAVIPGKGILASDGCYLIFKTKQENLDWYTQAVEIVLETIEYVLRQEDTENYYLYFSG